MSWQATETEPSSFEVEPPARVGGARARRDVETDAPPTTAYAGGGRRARRVVESVVTAQRDTEEPAEASGSAPSYVGGARARRDVPPLVGEPDPTFVITGAGKRARAWSDETAEVESWPAPAEQDRIVAPETDVAEAPTPGQFELEPEPVVDLAPLWADVDLSDLPEPAGPAEPVALAESWVAPDPQPESEPELELQPEAQPEPDLEPISWDVPLIELQPIAPERPAKSAAALLSELSFLD